MKKIIGIALFTLVGLYLTACGNQGVSTSTNEVNSEQAQVKALSNTEASQVKDEAKLETNLQQDNKIENKKEANKTNEPKKSEVLKSKIIVIDPGHASKANLEKEPLYPGAKEMKIKDGGGAAGIITKTPEYKVNMSVSTKLKELLLQKGYTVIMTKTEDSKNMGNVERAEFWNKINADLVIRIHADSAQSSSAKGASILIPAAINENTKEIYEKSKKSGQMVLDSLIKKVGMPNRGLIERKDMTGFNWSKRPVILAEIGFLSNKEEDKLLNSQDYQSRIAEALAEGIYSAIK